MDLVRRPVWDSPARVRPFAGSGPCLVAAVFALAVAGGLLWLTLRLIGTGPKAEPPREDTAPIGPERPSLPPKRPG